LRANINVRWETLKDQGRGSVSDLSATGCFILSGGAVHSGELVQMHLYFEDEIVALWGQIAYAVSEIGFAVRFMFAKDDGDRLRRLLDVLSVAG